MPTSLHEILVEMFRVNPSFAAELLGVLGLNVPAHAQARVESAEFTDIAPTEYRADVVVVLSSGDETVFAVVVEVQLRFDDDKQWTWPVYLTSLRKRLRCPVRLLVLCRDRGTAARYATPIDLGDGDRITPRVLGPDAVPVVIDPDDAAQHAELAVLSAMVHGGDPARRAVLDALPAALAAVDPDAAGLYCDVVLAALPEAARLHLEALVNVRTYEFQSEFMRRVVGEGRAKGRAEGRAVGKAEAVLDVLDGRGVTIDAASRDRVLASRDEAEILVWLRRAATAATVDELFAE